MKLKKYGHRCLWTALILSGLLLFQNCSDFKSTVESSEGPVIVYEAVSVDIILKMFKDSSLPYASVIYGAEAAQAAARIVPRNAIEEVAYGKCLEVTENPAINSISILTSQQGKVCPFRLRRVFTSSADFEVIDAKYKASFPIFKLTLNSTQDLPMTISLPTSPQFIPGVFQYGDRGNGSRQVNQFTLDTHLGPISFIRDSQSVAKTFENGTVSADRQVVTIVQGGKSHVFIVEKEFIGDIANSKPPILNFQKYTIDGQPVDIGTHFPYPMGHNLFDAGWF